MKELGFSCPQQQFYGFTSSYMVRRFRILFIFSIVASACGGKLSDEQRKRIKEDMKMHEIKRVTDAEITEAAYKQGRALVSILSSLNFNKDRIDSVAATQNARITFIAPGAAVQDMEKQLLDAYVNTVDANLADNIQKLDGDSLLYTLPLEDKLKDGSTVFKGMWSIRIARKNVILNME